MPKPFLNVELMVDKMRAAGVRDEQLLLWNLQGFPGAPDLAADVVLGRHHQGALKFVGALAEANAKDVAAGCVSEGLPFPQYWPCRVDSASTTS